MLRAPACLAALFFAAACASAQEPAEPANRIRERTKKDAEKLLPQPGLGGDEASKLEPDNATFTEVKIEVEGCEKMTGYVSLPEKIEAGRKVPLFFMFHGNGDVGQHRVRNHAKITTARDPAIVIGVQYQELQADGKGKMGLPTLATPENVIKGSRWLLDKVMKEHPVDPERVFVGGFSWGTAWASGWCAHEWETNPGGFPFRACFLYSSGGAASKTTIAPIVWVSFVGEEETAVLGSINVVESVRHWSNALAAWGIPVLYHEIPKMGHAVNNRCLQITRDLVNDLGGPGSLPYPSAGAPRPDPLPFAPSADPYVGEVTALCAEDRWPEAVARAIEIENDRKIPLKDKRAILAFKKEMEKFAQAELPRLDKLLAEAVKSDAMPNPFHPRRQKWLLEAYAKWPWAQKKSYAENLAKVEGDFPPILREKEREKQMREAMVLETEGKEKRPEAKALYEKLAARASEDGGKSPWPRAAVWRLRWWLD